MGVIYDCKIQSTGRIDQINSIFAKRLSIISGRFHQPPELMIIPYAILRTMIIKMGAQKSSLPIEIPLHIAIHSDGGLLPAKEAGCRRGQR